MLAILLKTLCFVTGLWLFKRYWSRRRLYEMAAKIPPITGQWPLFGVAPKFIGVDNEKVSDVLCDILRPSTISPRSFWFGPYFLVIVDDPAQLQQVLASKTCTDKALFYSAFCFEKSMLIINTENWKRHRKIIEPAFNPNILRSFLPIFNANTRTFCSKLEACVGKPEFDISDMMARLSLENILFTSTGLRKDLQNTENDEYHTHVKSILNFGLTKILKIWLHIKPIFRFTEVYQLEQKHVWNGMQKTANEVIEAKKIELAEKSNEPEMNDDETEFRKPQIFIDQLFKGRHVLSMEEISHEINVFILGGYETITNAMSAFIHLMAIHQNVQDKVFEELQTVFKSATEEVTDEHLDQLPYLEMSIRESLRYWAMVPISARTAMEDIQIGEHIVPAGTVIMIPTYQIHREKKIWGPDADVYRPERFAPEEIEKVHPYGFIPFLKGSRYCTGHKYAMNSMKVILSHVFRSYHFTTSKKVEDMVFHISIISRAINGYQVKVQNRNFVPQ